jgi:N-methylhydantoinase B
MTIDQTHQPLSAVDVEITRGRLQSIVDEAGAIIVNSAFSTIVREAKDFSCALLTPGGDTIVQASGIPPFLGTATNTAKGLLDCMPTSAWQPDAVIGTNDIWLGTGHLFDLTLVQPVYVADEIVTLSSVVFHMADIGGRGWGREARQVFEEGLQIPPLVLGTTKGFDPVIVELIRANVRRPDEVIGDIEAALNALVVMRRRFVELCVELTPTGFTSVCADLESRTEAVMRERISAVPDGRYRASFDSDESGGTSFHLELAVIVQEDEIVVDFDGSSPQVDAGINCCRAYARGYAIFALKSLLAPDLPLNEGLIRPLRYSAPRASIVNSCFPAAGTARNVVGMYVPTLIIRALSEAIPDKVIADSGSPEPIIVVTGSLDTGELFSSSAIVLAGGMGARATSDGLSVTSFPTNLRMVGVEVLEATSPLLFTCREAIEGSGGNGRFQGGLGQRVTLSCSVASAQAAVLVERLRSPPEGLRGGGPGTPTRVLVDGDLLEDCARPIQMSQSTLLTVESAGGGGYGLALATAE